MKDLWEIERGLTPAVRICGVDEAGRGPLAGPVCAAAVILPAGLEIEGLDDSKRLTDARRRQPLRRCRLPWCRCRSPPRWLRMSSSSISR